MANGEHPVEKHQSRWKRIHGAVVAIEPWGILLAVVALFMAVIQFGLEYADRVNGRTVRAWQLVTTVAPGNSGKIEALEYLNREDGLCFKWLQSKLRMLLGEDKKDVGCFILLKPRTPLVGINLSPSSTKVSDDSSQQRIGVYLSGANLARANLARANLSGVYLFGANLTRANLFGANLSGANLASANLFGANLTRANLAGANLTRADLFGANLTRANLASANLSGANLTRANLAGANLFAADLFGANLSAANLRHSLNLNQGQLDKACGDAKTKLPAGSTIRPCE